MAIVPKEFHPQSRFDFLLNGSLEMKPQYVDRIHHDEFKISFVNLWKKLHDITGVPLSTMGWTNLDLGDIAVQLYKPFRNEDPYRSLLIQKPTVDNGGVITVQILCPLGNGFQSVSEKYRHPPIAIERVVTRGKERLRELGIIMYNSTCATTFLKYDLRGYAPKLLHETQVPVIRDYVGFLNDLFKRQEVPANIKKDIPSFRFDYILFSRLGDVIVKAKKYQTALEASKHIFT